MHRGGHHRIQHGNRSDGRGHDTLKLRGHDVAGYETGQGQREEESLSARDDEIMLNNRASKDQSLFHGDSLDDMKGFQRDSRIYEEPISTWPYTCWTPK
jgi:hypothetical protein